MTDGKTLPSQVANFRLPAQQPLPIQGGQRNARPIPGIFAIPMMAATTFIMAYSALFGEIPILLFYALWLPQILVRGIAILRPTRAGTPFLLLAVFAIASITWSDQRAVTARAALELSSMILCAIIICRTVRIDAFIKGLLAGIVFVLVASLFDGSYGRDSMGGGYTLIGLFGSKNQLGLFAELGFYLSVVFIGAGRGRMAKLLYGVPTLILCVLCLLLSRSAASVVSLALSFFAVSQLYILTRFPKRYRTAAFFFSAVILSVAGAAAFDFGWQDAVFHGLGKDATLTGRTYLWSQGYKIGLNDPVLGHGFQAFWTIGRPEAERLWYEFFIASRSGFHFHNLFIEAFVELGMVGLLIVAAMLVMSLCISVRLVLARGLELETAIAVGLATMFCVRAFVEVDLLGPFGIGILVVMPIFFAWKDRDKKEGDSRSAGVAVPI